MMPPVLNPPGVLVIVFPWKFIWVMVGSLLVSRQASL